MPFLLISTLPSWTVPPPTRRTCRLGRLPAHANSHLPYSGTGHDDDNDDAGGQEHAQNGDDHYNEMIMIMLVDKDIIIQNDDDYYADDDNDDAGGRRNMYKMMTSTITTMAMMARSMFGNNPDYNAPGKISALCSTLCGRWAL